MHSPRQSFFSPGPAWGLKNWMTFVNPSRPPQIYDQVGVDMILMSWYDSNDTSSDGHDAYDFWSMLHVFWILLNFDHRHRCTGQSQYWEITLDFQKNASAVHELGRPNVPKRVRISHTRTVKIFWKLRRWCVRGKTTWRKNFKLWRYDTNIENR